MTYFTASVLSSSEPSGIVCKSPPLFVNTVGEGVCVLGSGISSSWCKFSTVCPRCAELLSSLVDARYGETGADCVSVKDNVVRTESTGLGPADLAPLG